MCHTIDHIVSHHHSGGSFQRGRAGHQWHSIKLWYQHRIILHCVISYHIIISYRNGSLDDLKHVFLFLCVCPHVFDFQPSLKHSSRPQNKTTTCKCGNVAGTAVCTLPILLRHVPVRCLSYCCTCFWRDLAWRTRFENVPHEAMNCFVCWISNCCFLYSFT